MTESTAENGHAPTIAARADEHAARAAASVAQHVADLSAILNEEDELQAALSTLKEASKERQHGLRKAIEALAPGTLAPKKGPGRPRKEDLPPALVRPRDEAIEKAYRLLVDAGEPLTVDKGMDTIGGNGNGISRDTLRRAFIALRDDGRVRIAGQTAKGGTLYAPMPDPS